MNQQVPYSLSMKYSIHSAGFLMALVSASLASAQSGNSTISGSVRDASEAALPAARVKITNMETGVQFETVTNSAGLYRAGSLVPRSEERRVGKECRSR